MATKGTKKQEITIDPDKTYKFELQLPYEGAQQHQGNYVIPREAIVLDPDTKKRRAIRYSSLEESPWVDEQSETAVVTDAVIQFREGKLSVKGTNENLIKYLIAFDGNADKEKTLSKKLFSYKLIDEEALFKTQADFKRTKIKVQSALMNATQEDLADFLLAEYGYSPKTGSIDELLDLALSKADKDPVFVSKTFNSKESKTKAKLKTALIEGVLRQEKDDILWGDTLVKIVTAKPDKDEDIVDAIYKWASKSAKESQDFLKKLDEKLEK